MVEVGTALRTFASYFGQRPAAEFKDQVVELLRRGVNYTCIAMDPDFAIQMGDPALADRIRASLNTLTAVKAEWANLPGKFELRTYSHGADSQNGRLLFTPYCAA